MPNEKDKKIELFFETEGLNEKLESVSIHIKEVLSILNQVDSREEFEKQSSPINFNIVKNGKDKANEALQAVNELKDKLAEGKVSTIECGKAFGVIQGKYEELMDNSYQIGESIEEHIKEDKTGKYNEFNEKYGDFSSSFVAFKTKAAKYYRELDGTYLSLKDKTACESTLHHTCESMYKFYAFVNEAVNDKAINDKAFNDKEFSVILYNTVKSAEQCARDIGDDKFNFFTSAEETYKGLLDTEIKSTEILKGIDIEIHTLIERQEKNNIGGVELAKLQKLNDSKNQLTEYLETLSENRQQFSQYVYSIYGIDPQTRQNQKSVEKDFIDKETILDLASLIENMGEVTLNGEKLVYRDDVADLSDALEGIKESFEKGRDDLDKRCADFYKLLEGDIKAIPNASCLKDYRMFNPAALPQGNLDMLLALHTAFDKYGTVLENTIKHKEIESQAKEAEAAKKAAEEAKANAPKYLNSKELEAERERFNTLAKALESAKTMVNSKEYLSIIKSVKELAQDNTENRAEKLAEVSANINDYLAHKAQDGVKANVFKKFAAVELLSKEVDDKLRLYEGNSYELGGRRVYVSERNLSLDKKVDRLNVVNKAKYDAVMTKDTFNLEKVDKEMDGFSKKQKAEVKGFMDPAHTYLKKVIAHAVDKGHGTASHVKMLNQFGNVSFACKELGLKSPVVQLGTGTKCTTIGKTGTL